MQYYLAQILGNLLPSNSRTAEVTEPHGKPLADEVRTRCIPLVPITGRWLDALGWSPQLSGTKHDAG